MSNVNEQMAEFANNLWENYIFEKHKQANHSTVSYYIATVVTNNGDHTLTIKKPFEDSFTVPCAISVANAIAGMQILVVQFGNGNNNKNHLAVARADGNPSLTNPYNHHIGTMSSSASVNLRLEIYDTTRKKLVLKIWGVSGSSCYESMYYVPDVTALTTTPTTLTESAVYGTSNLSVSISKETEGYWKLTIANTSSSLANAYTVEAAHTRAFFYE